MVALGVGKIYRYNFVYRKLFSKSINKYFEILFLKKSFTLW